MVCAISIINMFDSSYDYSMRLQRGYKQGGNTALHLALAADREGLAMKLLHSNANGNITFKVC